MELHRLAIAVVALLLAATMVIAAGLIASGDRGSSSVQAPTSAPRADGAPVVRLGTPRADGSLPPRLLAQPTPLAGVTPRAREARNLPRPIPSLVVGDDAASPYIRPVPIDSELRARESELSMHASPPVAAPSSPNIQRRQIVLVAAAAVVAFALAFGIGKAMSSSPETTTAAPARPQALKVAAVSIAAGAPAAGALPALKDPARAKHHKASKPTTSTSTSANNGQQTQQTQQTTQPQQATQPQQRVVAPQKQAPAKKKEPVITTGGGEN